MAVQGITYDVQVMWDGTNWTSLGSDPQEIAIDRGRTDDLATMQMGTCRIKLFDKGGKYAATSTTSPYAGQIRPMKRVRVLATTADGTFSLFYGFLTRCETNPDYGVRVATLEAADLMLKLSRATPILPNLGTAQTTGTAIGRLLDAIGWTDPTMRRLDQGDILPAYSSDGSVSALALIGNLLTSERGLFYLRGDGVAVYDGRYARQQGARSNSQATIGSAVTALAPGTDIATIYNRATVTVTGGTPQIYSDTASINEFGQSDYSAITTPYLSTAIEAMGLAQYLVARRKDPTPTARRLTLTSSDQSMRLPMLQRDLGDRVTVTNALGGLSGDYHIERLTHNVTTATMRHAAAWQLSPHVQVPSFVIGTSVIGGTDVIAY